MEIEPKIKSKNLDTVKFLTPEEIQIGQSLEGLKFLNPRHRVDLVLIWRKLKSASGISISQETSQEQIEKFEQAMKSAGIVFKDATKEREEKRGASFGKFFFVADREENLESFAGVWFGDHVLDPTVYKTIGRLSGYPQTAIDAFEKCAVPNDSERDALTKQLTLSLKEREEMFSEELRPFVDNTFIMSKAHWQEEMRVVQEWVNELKLVAPSLYEEFINKKTVVTGGPN